MLQFGEHDYKYVIQDFSNVYIGARSTYGDVVEADDAPSRFKDAIFRVFYKEISGDTMVYEHLLSLKDDSISYMAYNQLKILVKVAKEVTTKDKKGKDVVQYVSKDYSLEEFLHCSEIKEQPEMYSILEIHFKKRHLMTMHV